MPSETPALLKDMLASVFVTCRIGRGIASHRLRRKKDGMEGNKNRNRHRDRFRHVVPKGRPGRRMAIEAEPAYCGFNLQQVQRYSPHFLRVQVQYQRVSVSRISFVCTSTESKVRSLCICCFHYYLPFTGDACKGRAAGSPSSPFHTPLRAVPARLFLPVLLRMHSSSGGTPPLSG